MDEVIEFYKRRVDRAAIRENLKLTVEERFEKHARLVKRMLADREAKDQAEHSEESPAGGGGGVEAAQADGAVVDR